MVAAMGISYSGLAAQTVSVGLVSAWTGAAKLDQAFGIHVNSTSSTTPLRVFGEFIRASGSGFGVPCEPLIAEFCLEEPLEDNAYMLSAGISWLFPLQENGRWRLAAFPELMLTRARSTTRGRDTDREIKAQGFYPGVGAGLELVFRPALASDWAIRATGGVRHRLSLLDVSCEGCINQYDNGFFSGGLGLSVDYRFSP
jgi:hypothetical protein